MDVDCVVVWQGRYLHFDGDDGERRRANKINRRTV